MKEKEDLVRSYYDENYQKVFVEGSNNFLESLLVASCYLCIVILLFQKIRNGIKILKGTRDKYNSDHVDQRSLQFSILSRQVLNDQMQTKLEMLYLENQIPWFTVEVVFKIFNLSELSGNPIDMLML
jgi:Plant protein of unknown function